MSGDPIEFAGRKLLTVVVCAVCLGAFVYAALAVWAGDWQFSFILGAFVVAALAVVGLLELLARWESGRQSRAAGRSGQQQSVSAAHDRALGVRLQAGRAVTSEGGAPPPSALDRRGVDGDRLYERSVLLRSSRRP